MAEEIVDEAFKSKRRRSDIEVIFRHLIRAQTCGSYVRFYIKRDFPEKLDDIEEALNYIIRSWEYLREKELILPPIPTRRMVVLTGEKPTTVLTRGIMELTYAIRKLSKYKDFDLLLSDIRKALWTFQSIEARLREKEEEIVE